MDKKDFLEYLSMYGADLGRWPDRLGNEAEKALSGSPELRDALKKEKLFEEALNMRGFEEPSPDLARRIIDAAGPEKARVRSLFFDLLSSIFSVIPLPKPALALALLLVLGIAAGYLYANYADKDTNSMQLAELLYHEEGYYE